MTRLILLFCVLLITAVSQAQNTIVMQVTRSGNVNVPGEVTDPSYVNWIDVLSTADGMVSACQTGGGGQTTCSTQLGTFNITKFIDGSVTEFRRTLAQSAPLVRVRLEYYQSGGGPVSPYLVVLMENVQVTAIVNNSASGGDRMSVQISLSPVRIAWSYRVANTTSNFGWDIAGNQAWNPTF